jgi:tetratricopeptide (TPR) repeat protein
LKCLEKEPGKRYASAAALAEDLRRYLVGEPIAARPVSQTERVWRWCRRNQAVASLSAGIVLALVVGTAVSTWEAIRATRQERLTRQALDRVTEAEKKARSEADKARAVNDFLTQDLLSQAEPANTAAEDHVSLLEVLDRAAGKVGYRFAGQPEVEDALRRTIAGTYHGLASWEKAERQWRSVHEAAQRRLGGESPEALTAVGQLTHILRHRGRLDAEVLEMAKSAAEGLARVLGPVHPDPLTSRSNLALAYRAAGRTDDAIRIQEAELKLSESKLGPDHPDTLISRKNLANAYLDAGRTADAINMYEATLRLFESKLGPDHPDTLICRTRLAAAYGDAGRSDDAEPLLRNCLERARRQFGSTDLRTARVMGPFG